MLGGSQYGKGIPHALPLQTLDIGCCQLLDDLVILAETLVCPAPTNIQRDGNGGGKVPGDAGCCQLLGCGTPDTVNQGWVAGRSPRHKGCCARARRLLRKAWVSPGEFAGQLLDKPPPSSPNQLQCSLEDSHRHRSKPIQVSIFAQHLGLGCFFQPASTAGSSLPASFGQAGLLRDWRWRAKDLCRQAGRGLMPLDDSGQGLWLCFHYS